VNIKNEAQFIAYPDLRTTLAIALVLSSNSIIKFLTILVAFFTMLLAVLTAVSSTDAILHSCICKRSIRSLGFTTVEL
jgi:hypothetical protein